MIVSCSIRRIFRVVSLLSLTVLTLLVGGGSALADVPKNQRILLAQHISLDLPDIKIQGKVSLFSLNPLTGQLDLDEADGDPRRIFELISESSGLIHSLSNSLPIKQISLRNCTIVMTTRGVEFRFKSLVIPQGRMEDVSGEVTRNRLWTIESGGFLLNEFPLIGEEWNGLKGELAHLFPMGFSAMSGSGEQRSGRIDVDQVHSKGFSFDKLKIWTEQVKNRDDTFSQDLSLDGETLRIEEPARLPDPTGLIKGVMDYAGKAAQLGGILGFDRVMVRGVVHAFDAFQIKPVRFSAAELQIWGAVERSPQPEPGLLEVDLTAKRPGRDEKRFRWESRQPNVLKID